MCYGIVKRVCSVEGKRALFTQYMFINICKQSSLLLALCSFGSWVGSSIALEMWHACCLGPWTLLDP